MDDYGRSHGRNVYNYKNAEVVDSLSGVVEEEHLLESKPGIRASDYAEWESKKSHEVLISDADKRFWAPIWVVGEKVGAPAWLRQEVFWFYKKAKALKTRPEFKGCGLYITDERCILAVYYVVAKKRGLFSLAEEIALMPCGDSGEPCYINRKKGDRKFKKYLKIALRYASFIYPNNVRDPTATLNMVATQVPLPEAVFRRAREHLLKLGHVLGGRRVGTVAAASLGLALEEIFPSNWRQYFKVVCRCLNVSELSVKSLMDKIKKQSPP